MGKGRLEAFSDGVIAIIITIMVLELKVPHGASFDDLIPLLPVLGSYVLSFIYVGIYWNKLQYLKLPCQLLLWRKRTVLIPDHYAKADIAQIVAWLLDFDTCRNGWTESEAQAHADQVARVRFGRDVGRLGGNSQFVVTNATEYAEITQWH